jgi:hypothetical protein
MANFLLTLIFSFCLFNHIHSEVDPLFEKKFSVLEQAQYHKNEAIKLLKHADEIVVWMPNLEEKNHMHALIGAAITSIPVTNFKEKIFYIGLGLMASFSTDMYDKYCDLKNTLVPNR